MKKTLISICERSAAILAFSFAFMDLSSAFAMKVFLSPNVNFLTYLYVTYIAKLVTFQNTHSFLIFGLMLGIFIGCSRGVIPLNKYLRFNIIQAVLVDIICTCINSIYPLLPVEIRESSIGLILANFFYLGLITIILYCSIIIMFGRYPRIPVLSEAARLQVQRGSLD